MENKIDVSEYFYSLQGEGEYQGWPAVFFRTKNCNLFCGQPTDDKFQQKCSSCKWVCDTIAVWMKGETKTFTELFTDMHNKGYLDKLKEGAHLILTGGEPLLQQNALREWVKYLTAKLGSKPFVEVETNGTIVPDMEFAYLVDRFNVSAKLSNSGNPKPLRYNPEALKWHTENGNSIFKFVTIDEEDTKEIFTEFIEEFQIPRHKIWLMPGAYDRDELWKNGQSVAELCKKHGFKMTSRMHVEIWNKLTGV